MKPPPNWVPPTWPYNSSLGAAWEFSCGEEFDGNAFASNYDRCNVCGIMRIFHDVPYSEEPK